MKGRRPTKGDKETAGHSDGRAAAARYMPLNALEKTSLRRRVRDGRGTGGPTPR